MKLLFKIFFSIIVCFCKTPKEPAEIVYCPNWSYEFNYSYYPNTTGYESFHGKLIMQVLEGVINGNQQTILYNYYDDETSAGQEATGLIENSSRIWIHPPRSNIFKNLEFAPFPFINFVKNEWRQEIVLDPNDWGVDSKVKSITVINKYIKHEAEFIETFFGRLNCVVIKAKGISDLGSSKLTIHYNNKYGFVFLSYQLIDGSKLDIELKKVYKS